MKLIGRQLLIITLCTTLTGCSFLFTKSGNPPRCSTGNAGPVWDTVFASLQIGRTALAASNNDDDYRGAPIDREADLLLGLGFSVLFISSAIYGFRTTAKCRRASRMFEPSNVRYAPRPMAQARPANPAIRSVFAAGAWQVSLLGVPEEDARTVAIRIETNSLTQRFKNCLQLETTVDGATTMHRASYQARVRSGRVREVVVARVGVDALAAIGRGGSTTLGLCGQREVLPVGASAQIEGFLRAFAARGGAYAAPPPQAPRAPEVRLALVLEGQSFDLIGQPTLYPDYAFVVLPSVRPDAPGCGVLGVSVDRVTTSLPLLPRPGVDGAAYATIDVSLLRQVAAAADVTLSVCGVARKLPEQDRKAVGAFAGNYAQPAAPPPPAATPLPSAPGAPAR